MFRRLPDFLRRSPLLNLAETLLPTSFLARDGSGSAAGATDLRRHLSSFPPSSSSLASSPSLSIWRRKKEMGKEGLFVVQQLKRLASSRGSGPKFEQFMRSHVSRLLRTDLLAVLAEFLRQDHVFLSMKIYGVVRKEIWYHPDMYFYRDMLMMLARNKKIEEAREVWTDLRTENVRFDQHTYGDLIRAFCDGGLLDLAMEVYDDMRSSPDPPLSLPFRVILKGLISYPELRERVKKDFLELFPDMIVYDPPEDLLDEPK
ncbi:pentatricopeptide repeat-containing protein At1g62350 [Typha latifolia]|uniref:pentatricopeptide repeat-containing protein At1g62350 n=1 Tax=Typha latifolia TaxID=4733 RepID=UPI003C30D6F6